MNYLIHRAPILSELFINILTSPTVSYEMFTIHYKL